MAACILVDELRRLKKSSYDAVDNENTFSDFKKYMHIKRPVEDDLINTIETAKASNKKSLILVCGNVGDGKSHLISYLKHHENKYLDGFTIYNDATESRNRHLDEKQELKRSLHAFNDDEIDDGNVQKVILAINLGVLSNFIDSEEGAGFRRLAEYVNNNRILIDSDIADCNANNDYFYHVNFGDYHIYRLHNETVESPYISDIIEKVFGTEAQNTFNQAHSNCSMCELCDCCPVKHNYEMMRNPVAKKGIINVILETIIKDKKILSTRELLDFLFDIMVHPDFDRKKYGKCDEAARLRKYIDYSLVSIMYDHKDISEFLARISKYDFLTQRTEDFDKIVTEFNNTNEVTKLLRTNIHPNIFLDYILRYDIDEEANKDSSFREMLLLFFSRMCKIAAKDGKLNTVNDEFKDYIKYLYYANKREKNGVKELYSMVKNCIYLWNGSVEVGFVNLNTNHEDYVISTFLEVKPNLIGYDTAHCEDIFDRFTPYINISFAEKNDPSKVATVSVDYDLYKMLKKVSVGYRPTVRDNNHFAGFVAFVNKLSGFSKANEDVQIKHFKKDVQKKYSLKCDEFGTYEFKEM